MNASKETIIRSMVTLLAVINQLTISFGWYDEIIDENIIFNVVSAVVTLVTVVWSGWKNNSFTKAAIEADKYLKVLQNE